MRCVKAMRGPVEVKGGSSGSSTGGGAEGSKRRSKALLEEGEEGEGGRAEGRAFFLLALKPF